MPVFGICLGHQILSQAVGLETFKLPFGHRGGNHPVKDLRTGRIAITAQNHGFAVRGEAGQRLQTDFGEAELTHVNLYDGTIEGLRLLDVPPAASSYPSTRPAGSRTLSGPVAGLPRTPESLPPGGRAGAARLGRAVRRVHRRIDAAHAA